MATLILDAEASLDHRVPPGHPEHSGRYEAVKSALQTLEALHWVRARPASRIELERFHTADHVTRVLDACAAAGEGELVGLDADTVVSGASAAAGLQAAGAVVQAAELVMSSPERTAFCLARPPGHHAEPDRAMGFCLFNSIAVGACHALSVLDLERVAIIDIDVHHGNGSQCLAERDERVFFASIHQAPLYPGTGTRKETGLNGNVLNIPLPDQTSAKLWRQHFEAELSPALDAFQPQLIFVSAGFDGHLQDPLGGLCLQEEDYAWIASQLLSCAKKSAESRLVSTLEGGYDCPSLGRSAAAFVAALSAG